MARPDDPTTPDGLPNESPNARILPFTRQHELGNSVDAFRWGLTELGARGLSGMFLRGGRLVHTPLIGEEGYIQPMREDDDNGPATIAAVTPNIVITRLAMTYFLWRPKKAEGGLMVRSESWFPADAANHLLDGLDEAINLRTLRGITHTPTVRRDGSILTAPGYDAASGVLHLPDVAVPPIPEHPTHDERVVALALLRSLVDQFTWAGPHDECNYLGLMLTPLLRELCPPPYKLGAIGARQPGSGKSLLARLLRIVHSGVFRSEMPDEDEELGKSITSVLHCTTAPVITFDNVSGTLRSSRLSGLLTSATYSDRILGSTNHVEMPNDRLWTITGNNLNLGGDLVRRSVWVTIDPGVPNPELRTGFRLNLPTYVAQHRGAILCALLTLVAAWRDAGMPAEEHSSDDYARWSAVVRGILTVAGVPGEFDHQDSAQQSVGADDEGWGDFLVAVRAEMGAAKFTTRDLTDRMTAMPTVDAATSKANTERARALVDALPGELHDRYLRARENPQAITRSLGKWLRNRNGRWTGYHVCEDAGRSAAQNLPTWRIRIHGESS